MNTKRNLVSSLGCFAVIYFLNQGYYQVVLVRRRDGGYLELPGGSLDPSLDIASNIKINPYLECVTREVLEESGMELPKRHFVHQGTLIQRILLGTESEIIGDVHLYSYACQELGEPDFKNNLLEFKSDESSEVVVSDIDTEFFHRTDISLASKRMIAIALNAVENDNRMTYSALSQPVYIGRLKHKLFRINV